MDFVYMWVKCGYETTEVVKDKLYLSNYSSRHYNHEAGSVSWLIPVSSRYCGCSCAGERSACAAGQLGGAGNPLDLLQEPHRSVEHFYFRDVSNFHRPFSISERGYKITYKLADDANLVISKYGEYLYKHIVVFAPTVEEFGGDLSAEKLTEFIDDGGNILIAGSSETGDALRDLASECGFEVDEDGASVIDHLNYDVSDKGDHTTIVASPDNLIDSQVIVGDRKKVAPLLYRGTGLIADRDNSLILQLLTADSNAYSYNPDNPIKDYPLAVGKGTLLIAALQARNNARVVFSGSLFFFSDEALTSSVEKANGGGKPTAKSGNQEVVDAITKWVFGATGRLRVSSVVHHKEGEKQPPQAYTITEPVIYQIQIEALEGGKWVPFQAKDVQLEFVRIDPFVRTTLQMVKPGTFEARFKIPDVYGVYQFKVDYNRVGFDQLYSTTQVSVRPLQHTQYERFIPSAFPYYVSSFSMMIGLWIFSVVYLHYKDEPAAVKGKGDDKKSN